MTWSRIDSHIWRLNHLICDTVEFETLTLADGSGTRTNTSVSGASMYTFNVQQISTRNIETWNSLDCRSNKETGSSLNTCNARKILSRAEKAKIAQLVLGEQNQCRKVHARMGDHSRIRVLLSRIVSWHVTDGSASLSTELFHPHVQLHVCSE